ncbi:hypothetical protein EDP1_3933 [Pseudomonas putida S610]|nr:hypothetical protein EDP1_3933 [Pseudomonas putida S610]
MSCKCNNAFLKAFSSGIFWGAVALKCIQVKFGIL